MTSVIVCVCVCVYIYIYTHTQIILLHVEVPQFLIRRKYYLHIIYEVRKTVSIRKMFTMSVKSRYKQVKLQNSIRK
jgi:hypothetical protein